MQEKKKSKLVDYGKVEAQKSAHLIKNSTLYALMNPLELEKCA